MSKITSQVLYSTAGKLLYCSCSQIHLVFSFPGSRDSQPFSFPDARE